MCFEIELHKPREAGQAILVFLTFLIYEKQGELKISKKALECIGSFVWESTRPIKTICEILASKKEQNWTIRVADFNGLGTTEFKTTYNDKYAELKHDDSDLILII